MLTKEQIRNHKPQKPLVSVYVPALGDTVTLRYPTFKEWMDVVRESRDCEGKPTAEQIARTVSVCLANEDGTRMFRAGEHSDLLDLGHEAVMYLHGECWKTVLLAEGMVEAAEKN